MQPAVVDAELPVPISLEEADARDRAAYEQFFAGFDADPVVARYLEDDSDIPDFGAASNVSDEDFCAHLTPPSPIRKFKMPLPLPANPQSRKAVLQSMLALKRMSPQARAKVLEQIKPPKAK